MGPSLHPTARTASGNIDAIEGAVRRSGGIIVTTFGALQAAPGTNIEYLRLHFDWCDWNAMTESVMSGAVAGRTVTFSAQVSTLCRYINPTETVATTITATFTGTR